MQDTNLKQTWGGMLSAALWSFYPKICTINCFSYIFNWKFKWFKSLNVTKWACCYICQCVSLPAVHPSVSLLFRICLSILSNFRPPACRPSVCLLIRPLLICLYGLRAEILLRSTNRSDVKEKVCHTMN
jgi:hypothetical protein